jgi:hypothetical protein
LVWSSLCPLVGGRGGCRGGGGEGVGTGVLAWTRSLH